MAKKINAVFLCESVITRTNLLVMINKPNSEADRKKTSPYAKLGRISGHTLRGWLRHATEKLLLKHGVSVCHPLAENSITNKRNEEYYKRDLALGYHPRGDCKDKGGCLIYNMFGDLDKLGNLMVPSVYFFPTSKGDSTATKNVNKLFSSVGGGRVEVINTSPRARAETHQTYMTFESVTGVMIEAPFALILHDENDDQEILLLNTLEFLKEVMQEYDKDHMLGGMRNDGYGRAGILPMKLKDSDLKIQFKLTKAEATKLENKFEEVVSQEKRKFPIEEAKEKVKERGKAKEKNEEPTQK